MTLNRLPPKYILGVALCAAGMLLAQAQDTPTPVTEAVPPLEAAQPAAAEAAAQSLDMPEAPQSTPTAESRSETDTAETGAAVTNGTAQPATATSPDTTPAEVERTAEGIRLNFQDVPVEVVLDHLSKTAGFVVVKDADPEGTVDVISHQPLTPDEAVELLNVALGAKGYAAVRTGRFLRIVSRDAAKTYDLPVVQGNDPEEMPRSDEMVTQIIPVRYADATKLLENLEPLLGPATTINANQSSNAVVITDTRTNVRRMATIIQALDTSIATISEIRIYALQYADAQELATVVTTLFEQPSAGGAQQDPRERMRRFFTRMQGGGERGEAPDGDSEAKQAVSRIKAVADKRSNSLIVTAPTEVLESVARIVSELDVSVASVAEVRVYPLLYAEADDMAEIINGIFEDPSTSSRQNQLSQRRTFMRGPGTGPGADAGAGSDEDTRIKAVGDSRSNCIVVTAPPKIQSTVEELVRQVDVPSEDSTVVRVFPLEYAAAAEVAASLNTLFEDDEAQSGRQTNAAQRFGSRTGRFGSTQTQTSSRQLREATLTAVADTRTNAVIVSASEATLAMVGDVVKELDNSPKNVPQVYVYKIRHADLEKVLGILEGMFDDLEETSTRGTSTQTTGTATINRRRSN